MMVTFVSQCEKKALGRTRRVLDAFANRIGDNTWQTVITNDGLLTVKKMLRQTATKNTAVSCHWIRSRSRSQFLWVVGNKSKFNSEGYVAVNWTEKDLRNSEYESDWKYLPVIKALTGFAALIHDWGKASRLFQNKLNPAIKTTHKGDPIRHEWISCVLFKALILSANGQENDEDWLNSIIENGIDESNYQSSVLSELSKPLAGLPNLASLISWLVVSHHRLPLPKDKELCKNQIDKNNHTLQELLASLTQDWGYENRFDDYEQLVGQCFEFNNGLMSNSECWISELKTKAKSLRHLLSTIEDSLNDGSWRAILHHSRLCLMLGDHYYSSRESDKQWQSSIELFANTDRNTKTLKQKLDEHLVRVSQVAVNSVKLLPFFESEPLVASNLKALKPQPNTPEKFKWQDNAVQKILEWRKNTEDKTNGYFIANMASTGCGKTIANAKIMQALSDDKSSLRYVLALGLRTLTLQTGDEYREKLKLTDAELAVLIGSKSVSNLHQSNKGVVFKDEQQNLNSASGSESTEPLQDELDELHWQGILPEDELTTVLTSSKDRKLLYAPVLVCTIDHIMAATETKRGGRYILPCLRLTSSDLVIDEIDDFSGEDLIAIGRLVYLTAMLGKKVMISSATIPPDLALGLFNAYQQGWKVFATSRDRNTTVNCIFIDEHKSDSAHIESIDVNNKPTKSYELFQNTFIQRRVSLLSKQPAKRKANIHACAEDIGEVDNNLLKQNYFESIKSAVIEKHREHYTKDGASQRKVSFGVVRVANIQPCVELTKYLLETSWPEDIEIRCMAYHSQQVLLLRHEQEKHLDQVLKRKEHTGEQPIAFSHPLIRDYLDTGNSKHLIFILVATPVEEVGRDHDFDWAVIEPSSYRSIIQMAGRVRRHRDKEITTPNIALMQYNLRGFIGKDRLVFNRPGFETDSATELSTHNLMELVDESCLLKSVDAIPRIFKPEILNPSKNLSDLEHFAIAKALGTYQIDKPLEQENSGNRKNRFARRETNKKMVYWNNHLHGHIGGFWWLTGLPQYFVRFRKSLPSINLYLVKNGRSLTFCERDEFTGINPVEKLLGIEHEELPVEWHNRLWLFRDYESLLEEYKQGEHNDYITSLKFGEISFTDLGEYNRYKYNDQFGLVRV